MKGIEKRKEEIEVKGKGEGKWIVGKDNRKVGDEWIWIDERDE